MGWNSCSFYHEKSVSVSYTKKMNYLNLSELSYLIKSTIHSSLNEEYWVTAEIAQINCHYNSGHCYLDLIEKQDDATLAKMRATIWARNYSQISTKFRALTGQDLQAGMKILMLVNVTFHEVYGLSLNIKDIDPRYTLGEMALKRREIIERLKKESIIDKNRNLPLPPVIQNIAVISSVTAAGYGDFIHRLDDNPYGYRFSYSLFQAYVQGEQAEESILLALRKCNKLKDCFDAVVIIRGGGSTVDLQCFDSYPLSKEIALFPLPVFTGIGHERDETVADRVANKRLITPTAVAEFLITKAKQFEDSIETLRHRLIMKTNTLLERERHYLMSFEEGLSRHSKYYLAAMSHRLGHSTSLLHSLALGALRTPSVNLKAYEGSLKSAGDVMLRNNYQKLKDFAKILQTHPEHMLKIQSKNLEHLESTIKHLDPINVLKRGYSITYLNGKTLNDITTVKKADIIDTRLCNGTITSTVEGLREDKKSG
jgi:exodeoxyribonuclease VII large subunit